MKILRGIVFDLDGTLVDSNDAHAEAFQRAFQRKGIELTFREIRQLIGMGADHLIPKLIGISADSEVAKEVIKIKDTLFAEEYFAHLKAFPKARELLESLHRHGLKLTVATSGGSEDLQKLLQKFNFDEFVQKETSADDAEHSKPDADLIHAALRKLKLSAAEAMMIGDTPYDIEASERAGVRCIAFRTGNWNDHALRNALAIYDSPLDLLKNLDTSPILNPQRYLRGHSIPKSDQIFGA